MRIYLHGNPNDYMDIPGDENGEDYRFWTRPENGFTKEARSEDGTQTALSPSAPPPGSRKMPNMDSRYHLVTFSGGQDPTPEDDTTGGSLPWIYDLRMGTYHGFKSQSDFDGWSRSNGVDPQLMMSYAETIDPLDTVAGKPWQGTFLSTAYSPRIDGKIPAFRGGNPNSPAITGIYGQEKDAAAEQQAANMLSDVLVPAWVKAGILGPEIADSLDDPYVVARYVSALAYGGYKPGDVWRDMRAGQLSMTDPSYSAVHGISDGLSRDQFVNTQDYAGLRNDTNLMVPSSVIQSDQSLYLDTPVHLVGDQAYNDAPDENIDWSDPKNAQIADIIQAGYFDALQAKFSASTEQEKRIADYEFEKFIRDINENFNLNLPRNAEQAWSQIESLSASMESRGLGDSGVEDALRDEYLARVRKSNQIARDDKADAETERTRQMLLTSGSPDQIMQAIARMDDEDQKAGLSPDKFRSVLWGLKPSAQTMASFSLENIKRQFPDYTDEEARAYRNQFIDEFGNYRSTLYQNSLSQQFQNQQNKKTYQQATYDNNQAMAQAHKDQPYQSEFSKNSTPENEAAMSGKADDASVVGSDAWFKKNYPTAGPEAIASIRQGLQLEGKYSPVTASAPVVTESAPAPTYPSGMPSGATKIRDRSQLEGLTEDDIWRDSSTGDIYRRASTAAAGVTTTGSSTPAPSTTGTKPTPAPVTQPTSTVGPAPVITAGVDKGTVDSSNRYVPPGYKLGSNGELIKI